MTNRNRVATALTLCALAVCAAACAATSGRETSGQYLDDATISTKVRAKLVGDTQLKSFEIGVETMQNVVQLSGFVDSREVKLVAGRDAMGVSGVRSVDNNLVVR